MGAEDCGCAGKTATPTAPERADASLPSATAGTVTASGGLASASVAAAAKEPVPKESEEPDRPKEPTWPNAHGKAPWEWWAKQKRTGALELRRTALHQRWPAGRELTEADFDAAVKASDAVIR